jgi:hypothetical protein
MLYTKRLALFLCILLLGACTVTGPADDGYDNSNEWVDNGRLLSSDDKTLYKSEQKQASVKAKQASLMPLDDKAEFEEFKIWNKLRTKGEESEEYMEFIQWLNYQDFKAKQ